MPPSDSMTNQTAPYGSYGYPNMQQGYGQGPPSQTDSSPSHDPYSQSSYNQYSQVSLIIDVYVYLAAPKSLMWANFKPFSSDNFIFIATVASQTLIQQHFHLIAAEVFLLFWHENI